MNGVEEPLRPPNLESLLAQLPKPTAVGEEVDVVISHRPRTFITGKFSFKHKVHIVYPPPVVTWYDTAPKPIEKYNYTVLTTQPWCVSVQWAHALELVGRFCLT